MSTHYTLEGELWSGAYHMARIDRETAARLIRVYGANRVKRRGSQWAEFPLSLKSSKHLESPTQIPVGYHYRNISVGLTRDPSVAARAKTRRRAVQSAIAKSKQRLI